MKFYLVLFQRPMPTGIFVFRKNVLYPPRSYWPGCGERSEPRPPERSEVGMSFPSEARFASFPRPEGAVFRFKQINVYKAHTISMRANGRARSAL